MPMKTKVLLIAGGSAALALLCTILYFTSDHHAYNVAVKRYRQKEHKAAIAIIDRLSPKYQRSSKATYLRSVCQYNIAVESYGRRDYDASLNYLSAIPDTYMNYDEVKELRGKIKETQEALAQERERQRQIEETKRKERDLAEEARRKERDLAEEARRKADEPARLVAERKKRVESGFSLWNGSHRGLTAVIKKSMNDPKSYEHVETTYADKGDHLIVKTTFRGKNVFGGVVVNWIMAKADLDGNIIEVIAQGP